MHGMGDMVSDEYNGNGKEGVAMGSIKMSKAEAKREIISAVMQCVTPDGVFRRGSLDHALNMIVDSIEDDNSMGACAQAIEETKYPEPKPEWFKKELRDRFAMAALTGMVEYDPQCGTAFPTPASAADASYEIADAMLVEREKKLFAGIDPAYKDGEPCRVCKTIMVKREGQLWCEKCDANAIPAGREKGGRE